MDRAGDSGPSDAHVARMLIVAATKFLEAKTGFWYGPPRRVTRYYTGKGSSTLWLPGPIFDTEDDAPAVTEATAPGVAPDSITDFVVRDTKLVRVWPAFWYRGYEYAVTFKTGYLTDTGPAAEREGVFQYALALWQQSSPLALAVASGLTGEELDDYSYEADGEGMVLDRVPQAMLDIINVRRRMPV